MPNKMDEKPFLEFNITEIKDNQIEELKKFHKANFDAESIVNTASEMKFMNELKHLLNKELTEPTPEFKGKHALEKIKTDLGCYAVRVRVQPEALATRNISLDEISAALKAAKVTA